MFKLGTATSGIVVLVTLLQASVGLQIFRMNDAQTSISLTSMPLLDQTQEFARLTTRVVSQTALLGGDLSETELIELWADYIENKGLSEGILLSILETFPDRHVTTGFQQSQDLLADVNEQLFDNQFEQRAQEKVIDEARLNLLSRLSRLEDLLDQSLISATTRMLDPKFLQEGEISSAGRNSYRKYAGEIEVLNSLRSSVIDISSMLGNITFGQDIEGLTKDVSFQLRGLAQSLTLLRMSQTSRGDMARSSLSVNRLLTQPGGLFDLLKANRETRREFDRLKREQLEAVHEIDLRTDQIVFETGNMFQNDIEVAAEISQRILWIGIATTVLVLSGIYILNHHVIRQQISERFVTLTEDVLAIAGGDYGHHIRVGGQDEIGHIADALNGFKGQAAELQRSNAELERFAYVAAHDLRSPLDAIQDLAKWTLEDERDNLSPACIRNLELLIRRSSRLSELQSDLLTYAKAADMSTAAQELNLQDEIRKFSDLLDPEGNFRIRLENDPGSIVTYGLPVRQILLNLITNAIKHHDAPAGNIIVHYEHIGETHRMTVEDDGPGIEWRFQKKIFELFKTLKSRDQVEGSGLGLALVGKLVERLNGKLWVESHAPKRRGSKFGFELADLARKRRSNDLAA